MAGPPPVGQQLPGPAENDKTTTQLGTSFAGPSDWVASLPRGEDVRAAYATGRTLHVGDVSTTITGPYVESKSSITLYDPVAGGWLATVLNFGNRAEFDFRPQNGVIVADGTFIPFTDQPHVFAMSLLASPDGTQFAVGPDIRDVATGAIVESFPRPEVLATAWFDEGIAYNTTEVKASDTRMWLWQPGSAPVEIFFEIASNSGGIVVTADGDCAAAGRLSEPPSTYQRFCEGRVLSISPTGQSVFTESFVVVDVASGDATTLPVPKFDRPRRSYWSLLPLTTFWEDEDHLVMLIPGVNQEIFSFVRCELSTNTCERASDELLLDDAASAPLQLSPID